MTNSAELKNKLGEHTKNIEEKIRNVLIKTQPYYTKQEPWKRGLILMALVAFLIWVIYYLTKKEKPEPRELTDSERRRLETIAEERILKRAEFLSRLRK